VLYHLACVKQRGGERCFHLISARCEYSADVRFIDVFTYEAQTRTRTRTRHGHGHGEASKSKKCRTRTRIYIYIYITITIYSLKN